MDYIAWYHRSPAALRQEFKEHKRKARRWVIFAGSLAALSLPLLLIPVLPSSEAILSSAFSFGVVLFFLAYGLHHKKAAEAIQHELEALERDREGR